MRRPNMGGALGALLLAGAAYAWRNRDQLAQQLDAFRGSTSNPDRSASQPRALPDLSASEQRDFERTQSGEHQFGGTRM